jgi:hypothetical protein
MPICTSCCAAATPHPRSLGGKRSSRWPEPPKGSRSTWRKATITIFTARPGDESGRRHFLRRDAGARHRADPNFRSSLRAGWLPVADAVRLKEEPRLTHPRPETIFTVCRQRNSSSNGPIAADNTQREEQNIALGKGGSLLPAPHSLWCIWSHDVVHLHLTLFRSTNCVTGVTSRREKAETCLGKS